MKPTPPLLYLGFVTLIFAVLATYLDRNDKPFNGWIMEFIGWLPMGLVFFGFLCLLWLVVFGMVFFTRKIFKF